jgi:hypothetical protein
VGVLAANRAPGVPGDLEDYRRDGEADQRVGDREAKSDDSSGCNHGQAHVGVSAGVVAVSNQRWAVETMPGAGSDDRGDPIAGKADDPGPGQGEKVRRGLGMDETRHSLHSGDAGRYEDRGDDE